MAKYDLENLLSDIGKILKEKINAKFEQIDNEKNDDIKLQKVDENAYFVQTLDDKIVNWRALICYGVVDIAAVANGPNVGAKYTISVVVLLADDGQTDQITSRLLRCQRALVEVFQEDWNKRGRTKLEIKSQIPIPVTDIETGKSFRAIGIELDANLG